jgi:hypothetical protein
LKTLVGQVELIAWHCAITREHQDGSVGLQNSQGRHQPCIVSLALAAKDHRIEASFGREVNCSDIVIGRQDQIAGLTQSFSGLGQTAGEVIQT